MKSMKLLIPTFTLGLTLMAPLMSHAEETVQPDKVEKVTTDSGEEVEVKYFDDPADAEKYQEQNMNEPVINNTVNRVNSESLSKDGMVEPMGLFTTTYDYNGQSGHIGKDFDVQVYKNNTGSTWVPETSVTRRSTDSVTMSLNASGEFKSVYSASVGVTYGQTKEETWTTKFDGISVPEGDQLEIWTNNIAEKHSFTEDNPFSSDRNFTAYRSTDSWNTDVVVTDIRNPY